MSDAIRYLTPTLGVDVIDDVTFGQAVNETGILETLKLDVYLPAADPAPLRPAILWFHGGGFAHGNDKRQRYIPMFANAFAARGYVGIAPDYRLRANPRADFPGAIRDAVADARTALAWVRQHSTAYRIDPSQLALAGGSAGGMTVVSLVHDAAQPIHGKRDGVIALLDMWGTPRAGERSFARVNPNSPPTFIIHGTADALVPYQNSVDFVAELAQAGVAHKLLTLPDAPHTPLMHFEQIVDEMAAFLHEYVSKP
jgi:acetyl esterase/lipase